MEALIFVEGRPRNCPIQSRARAIISSFTWFWNKMAASFLNKLGFVGLGIACVGGVVNTALFNG